MTGTVVYTSAAEGLRAIPSPEIWGYLAGALVLAIGLALMFHRRDWQRARGLERLILFGPIFFGAPVAAFGTEHFSVTKEIAGIVPQWIPWHYFWAYLVGACFIAAGLSLATRVQTRLAASLLALTFFLFVVLMDAPGWAREPRNRFALALMLRELSFSGGALALAASLGAQARARGARIQATVARYFVAVPMLFYSLEQFLHADHVPAIPLELVTPTWIFGHTFWTYLAAAVYVPAGLLLVAGKGTRAAAAWAGLTVFAVELAVYVPIAIAERATLTGINYFGDTLMYCGAVLLLAGAMPRQPPRGAMPAAPRRLRKAADTPAAN